MSDNSNNNSEAEEATMAKSTKVTKTVTTKPIKKTAVKKTASKKSSTTATAAADGAKSTKATKGSKRTKKEKKPGPKRALSAYMYYANSQRKQVKEEHPELSFGELTKVIADQWKVISAEVRAPYEEQARQDKERYVAEKAQFSATELAQMQESGEA